MYRVFFLFCLAVMLLCTNCTYQSTENKQVHHATDSNSGFTLEKTESGYMVSVHNPWQGAENISLQYLLVDQYSTIPSGYGNMPVIRIPVQKVVVMSTTYIGMIDKLGKLETIKGISGKQLMSNNAIIKAIEEGRVIDVGYDQGVDIEHLLDLQPDVIFTYGVSNEGAPWVKKLIDAGINVVYNADYLENTPLGMASWLRFFAAFYNDLPLADSILHATEKAYHQLAHSVDTVSHKPGVLPGLPWKGTWYMPGGTSYMVNFIEDAGGYYPLKDHKGRENLPLDIEAVYSIFNQADVWINTGSAASLKEISGEDTRLAGIKAFRKGRVYNNTARVSAVGGNDYWESGPVNPHIILKDLISIFHPHIFPSHELVYFKLLE